MPLANTTQQKNKLINNYIKALFNFSILDYYKIYEISLVIFTLYVFNYEKNIFNEHTYDHMLEII